MVVASLTFKRIRLSAKDKERWIKRKKQQQKTDTTPNSGAKTAAETHATKASAAINSSNRRNTHLKHTTMGKAKILPNNKWALCFCHTVQRTRVNYTQTQYLSGGLMLRLSCFRSLWICTRHSVVWSGIIKPQQQTTLEHCQRRS